MWRKMFQILVILATRVLSTRGEITTGACKNGYSLEPLASRTITPRNHPKRQIEFAHTMISPQTTAYVYVCALPNLFRPHVRVENPVLDQLRSLKAREPLEPQAAVDYSLGDSHGRVDNEMALET